MRTRPRSRRWLLAVVVGGLAGVAGCLDDVATNVDDDGATTTGDDGDGTAPEASADRTDSDYPTETFDGTAVPLVPTADAAAWDDVDDATFVDARSPAAYEEAHVDGALSSPAPDGYPEDDPVAELDPEDTIVTYCRCPHHLSGLRAASLLRSGYESVYALDEGFDSWIEAGHPIAGSAVQDGQADLGPVRYHVDGEAP